MSKRKPESQMTDLERELYAFVDANKAYWAAYFDARESAFPELAGPDGKIVRELAEDRQKEFHAWDAEYVTSHPKLQWPRAIKLDLELGHRGLDAIENHLDSGYFSKDKIVVFREKHGERTFMLPAGDQSAHGRVALKVIAERSGWGFYCYSGEKPVEPGHPEISEEQAGKMPEKYKKMVLEEWCVYRHAMEAYRAQCRIHALFAKAIAGDPLAAVAFLRGSINHQYEKYQVIIPEVA